MSAPYYIRSLGDPPYVIEPRRRIREEWDKDNPQEAWFLDWAHGYVVNRSHFGKSIPAAIVERDDGKVELWAAEDCRFIPLQPPVKDVK